MLSSVKKMSGNIKTILVKEKYQDLKATQPSQEKNLIAESVSDILESYKVNQVEISHSLEFDECVYFLLHLAFVSFIELLIIAFQFILVTLMVVDLNLILNMRTMIAKIQIMKWNREKLVQMLLSSTKRKP